MRETQVPSLGGKDPPGEGNGLPVPVLLENSMDSPWDHRVGMTEWLTLSQQIHFKI